MSYQIYIVDDHALTREAIHVLLESEPDLNVCGTAVTGEEAFDELVHVDADLILVDICLPEMSGIDLVGALLERQPDLRCVMHSGHDEATYVRRALTAGARGYLLKGAPDDLPEAIRRVLDGEVYLSEPFRES